MTKWMVVSLFCLGSVWGQDLEPQRYRMAELELMAKKKNWANIILFIKDVPKSEQDLQWNDLLERAAIGYVAELNKGGFSDSESVMGDLLREFPALKKSGKFAATRNEIVMSGFEKCFGRPSDRSECASQGLKKMEDELSSSELRQKLGKLIGKNQPESWEKICQVLDSLNEHKGLYEKQCSKSHEKKNPDQRK